MLGPYCRTTRISLGAHRVRPSLSVFLCCILMFLPTYLLPCSRARQPISARKTCCARHLGAAANWITPVFSWGASTIGLLASEWTPHCVLRCPRSIALDYLRVIALFACWQRLLHLYAFQYQILSEHMVYRAASAPNSIARGVYLSILCSRDVPVIQTYLLPGTAASNP